MRPNRSLTTLAVAAVTASLGVGLTTLPARAASSVASGDGASSTTGNLLGTLAYRGAEHPYLVGNVADARRRFGPGSAQAAAAAAGLTTNVNALAATLGGGSATIGKAFAGDLAQRDRDELSYAAAVAAGQRAALPGETAAQKQAKQALTKTAGTLAGLIHSALPTVSVAKASTLVTKLDAGDLIALRDNALDASTQFIEVEASSVALSSALVDIGALIAGEKGLSGSTAVSGGVVEVANGAAYRAALVSAYTQHVYQTGLLGQAVLLFGPRSPATIGARRAEDLNTALIAFVLSALGPGRGHTQAIWDTHITGYGDYLTGLATASAHQISAATPLLASYEAGITSLVHRAVPALSIPSLRAAFDEHVTMTLAVFRAEKAKSASVYPMALLGAMHFSDLATAIATRQTEVTG